MGKSRAAHNIRPERTSTGTKHVGVEFIDTGAELIYVGAGAKHVGVELIDTGAELV